ncbi:MAG: hypothetical protein ABI142_12895, partial [Bryocella sp.]
MRENLDVTISARGLVDIRFTICAGRSPLVCIVQDLAPFCRFEKLFANVVISGQPITKTPTTLEVSAELTYRYYPRTTPCTLSSSADPRPYPYACAS